jgi:hypothetical protein
LADTTTGGERVVPGQQPSAADRGSLAARLVRPVVAHWQFALVALAAVVVRIVVVLGYPPVFWFSDSYNYIYDAVTHVPDEVRPNGYPFFLDLLLPLHSDDAIGLVQAAMGVAIGVAIYALLRHRGLPWWGAVLPALPVLFDVYELHLEHMITADPLFIFLVTVAVVMLCWTERPSVWTVAVAGLLIGYAALVRSVGYPLLVVVLAAMLARRVGWRRLAALVVAGIVPIGAYMLWFHGTYGHYALTESSGPFLYSRVSTFAECSKMKLPENLRFLCDPLPPKDRPPAGEYIWADNDLPVNGRITYTPLYKWSDENPDTGLRFTAAMNAKTREFAEHAIESQPLAYASAAIDDTLHTFGWTRQPDPNDWYGNGPNFRFTNAHEMNLQIPWYATPSYVPGNLYYLPDTDKSPTWCDASCQQKDGQARVIQTAERDFAGGGLGFTRGVPRWANFLQIYERYIYLRGTLLGVIVLIGAAGVLARWRRWGGTGLLPWLVGALLIVVPPMTSGFSYRYVLAAVPVACLAAGLAFTRQPGQPRRSVLARGDDLSIPRRGSAPPDPPGKPRRSVRALAADLRRNFSRGGAVDQE